MVKKKQLHTSIKDIVQQNGIDTIRTIQLANILADYSAYDEYPATKVVLKDILNSGYGQRIMDVYSKYANGSLVELEKIEQEYTKAAMFKKDVVNYVFDSIYYGLGLISYVNEPTSNNFDPYKNESDNILEKLPDMLAELKDEYQKAINRFLVLPKDIIWDAAAYYTATAENQLYLIEGKIHVINNQLGLKDNNWCKNLKEKTLNLHRQRKIHSVKEFLEAKKIEFTDLLNKALVKPSPSYIAKSGYYAADKLSSIGQMESDIKNLYIEMSATYDNWCELEKKRIVSPYIVPEGTRLRQILMKIATPVLMVLIIGYYGGTYSASTDEINTYEQRIESAEEYLADGNYGSAILGFMQASSQYDGRFRTTSYKDNALQKADACFDQAKNSIPSLIASQKYIQVLSVLNSIPPEYLSENQAKSDWIEKTKIDLQNKVNKEVKSLAEIISSNGGHLTDEGRDLLEQFLAVSPNDYWLNVIKNKEQ